MSKSTITVLTLSLGLLAGCSKDGEILEFIKVHDALVAEIDKTSDPDAAQKAFDSKKEDLKKQFDGIKTARGFQVKPETTQKLTESVTAGATKVCGLQIKAITDKTKMTKYKKLCDDYSGMFKM